MARQDKKLVAEAKALGIDVDGRWGDETIQERIDVVKANQVTEGQDDGAEEPADGNGAVGEAGGSGPAASEPAHAEAADAGGEVSADGAAPEGGGNAAEIAGGTGSGDRLDAAGEPVGNDALVRTVGGDGYVRTDDIVSEDELRAFLSIEPEEADTPDIISTHDGDWRREDEVWRFWKHPDVDAEEGDDAAEAEAAVSSGADVTEPDRLDARGSVDDATLLASEPLSGGAVSASAEGDHSSDAETSSAADVAAPERAEAEPASGVAEGGEASAEHMAGDDAADVLTDDGSAEAAEHAMTKPILAAFQAACSVHGVMTGESTDRFAVDTSWMPGADVEDRIINLVRYVAPFVRQWPDAPVEALYGHVASAGGVYLVLDILWSDLDLPARLAWRCLRDTLVSIDREKAAEAAIASQAAEARELRRVPIDETTLEEIERTFERTEVAGGPR